MKKLLLSVAIFPLAIASVSCGGSGSSAPPPPPPPPPPPAADTQSPSVSFSPATATVGSGGTVASTLSATDNVGVTTGPTVTCDNGGSFANNTFTAPVVTAQTTSVCTATASDAAGNSGSATLTVTITPPAADTTVPVITFAPATLTVASGGTGTSTLTATDNVDGAVVPTISCTNGGAFSGSTFTAPTVTAQTTSICTATASDAAGNTGTGTLTVTINPAAAGKVTISGKATFDFVPFQADNTGLDYGSISQQPARGLTLEALNGAGAVLASTKTDANGDYSVEVDPNTQVRLRMKAELIDTVGTTYNASVVDNTNNDALYAVQGTLTSSGAANSTRNLNAASGWNGSSYASTRAAAPFAILSPIYDTYQVFEGATAQVTFPPISFGWATTNRAVSGNTDNGEIGTSSYRGNGTTGQIFILGDANNDTDEYDDHVIVHEWGHYFEDLLSRSDSIGGQHGGSDRLDIRVAMGEGWGNAVSGIGTGDPVYKDSLGASQGNGFAFSVEDNSYANEGWFNEGSVQSIIYDLFDSNDDAADTLSLGINPILNTFLGNNYKNTTAFTSIFAFIDQLRVSAPGNDAAITALLAQQTINGSGDKGTGETNNGGIATSLPVYKTLAVGGAAINICSVDDAGNYNKLNNRVYLTFDVAAAGTRTITMTRTSGPASTDPDFAVYNTGNIVVRAESGVNNSETLTRNYAAGSYAIDAYEFTNVQGGGSDSCFNISAN